MMKSIFKPERLTVASAGWLAFSDEYDEDLAEYEGYIYRGESGRYYAGTYHQDVGQETYLGPFATESDAESFMEANGFANYSG